MGSRNPQIPGDKEYLSTIKKKITLGENNNKVFNRFGQGSNARNMKETLHMQPKLFLLDTDNFLSHIDKQIE